MGFLKSLVSVAVSPVTLVKKTVEKTVDESWKVSDFATLGLTKVASAAKDTAQEIEEDFEE